MGLLFEARNPILNTEQEMYWRIAQFNYSANRDDAHIVFEGYVSQDAYKAGGTPVASQVFDVTTVMDYLPDEVIDQLKSVIYTYAKAATFTNAKDVLEEGQVIKG